MLLLRRRNPCPVMGVRKTAKARWESAPGTGKGAQWITGWARLAGTSGGLLAHPRAQGCVMLCHPVGCYSELCCTVSHCKNHTFSFVFSPFFRASDDIKVLSSGFSEEERKMSAFLNSKTTRSSRGTSSLFYCIEKNTLNWDVLWLVHLIASRRVLLQLPFCRRQSTSALKDALQHLNVTGPPLLYPLLSCFVPAPSAPRGWG